MATITTDTFFDAAARTAGEAWTITPADVTLTLRTDTRWHAGAPAGMVGTLGGVSATSGGHLKVDGTKVRWLAFNNGSGNIPPIGTLVSQGATSGYMLGVWPTVDGAPLPPGTIMPTTGFIKFREVEGSFAAGALGGVLAFATAPDTTGWIEIATDSNVSFIMGVISRFVFDGAWFYLDNTTGARGQQIKTPTNGGGANTHVFGVQIETSPGSNVFEWFPAALATQVWTTANIAADARAKVVETMGGGIVRIGSNGTDNIGYLPPAGCRVRIPNIIVRNVATTSRSINLAPGNTSAGRARFNSAGTVNLNCASFDWASMGGSNISNINITNSVFETYDFSISNNLNPSFISNCLFMNIFGGTAKPFNLRNSSTGFTITDTKFAMSNSTSAITPTLQGNSNIIMTNIETNVLRTRTSGTTSALVITNCSDSVFTDMKIRGGSLELELCVNVKINGTDYIDKMAGDTLTTAATNAIKIATCSDITVDGFTFGNRGELTNTQSYNPIFFLQDNLGTVRIRNIGTRLSPVNTGTVNLPSFLADFSTSGAQNGIKLQRLYFTNFRTALYTNLSPSNSNFLIESSFGAQTLTNINAQNLMTGANLTLRGNGTQPVVYITAGVQGSSWNDGFNSDTTGFIGFTANAPSQENSGYVYFDSANSTASGFVATGTFALYTVGDRLYAEMPYFALGHTGFQNVNPLKYGPSYVNTVRNILIEYQLDVGNGWSGVWKELTGKNLSSEIIQPSGFKMKWRFTATVAGISQENTFSNIVVPTTSSIIAQAENLYPLDSVALTLEGLKPGSEVRAYVGTDPTTAVQIGGTESSAETFSFTHTSSGQEGYIHIFAMGYQPIMIPRTYAFEDSSMLIQQVIDRNYINP